MADKKIEETIEEVSIPEENKEIDSSNIFDEFVDDSNLIDEVNKIKTERNKDVYFYFSKIWDIFQTIFWLWIITFILLFSYIYVQNNENLKNNNILDPFCIIILWDIKSSDNFCSSIASLKKTYSESLKSIETRQVSDILSILEELYRVENFVNSKDVLFLRDKTENKLPVLSILENFDDMKNEFNSVDKQKIQCSSISIDWNKKTLSLNCVAYAEWFEKWLRWYDWSTNDTLKGTSISIANSFLNYIEKQSKIFTIVNKQKVFKSETILWKKTNFTNKTQFSLILNYNLK